MSTILLQNPAIATANLGNHIIGEAAKQYLYPLFVNDFWVEISSTVPIMMGRVTKRVRNVATLSFVLGANMLSYHKCYRPIFLWEFNILSLGIPSVLLGVGWRAYQDNEDIITRKLYKKILASDFIHSVRDDYTLEKLFDLGIKNVINTGCPTMWGFSTDFINSVEKEKVDNVVTALTDYSKNTKADNEMISILSKNYTNVYIWPQGEGDVRYLHSLNLPKNLIMLPPSIEEFDKLLSGDPSIEYVGTRLHAGIRALQHKRRTLILGVDNRALEMHRSFNIPVLPRDEISELEYYIFRSREPGIVFDFKPAQRFLDQFS